MFSAFSQDNQDELAGLQAGFSRFKDKFDRGISVQTMITAERLESQLKEVEKQLTDLRMFSQVIVEGTLG